MERVRPLSLVWPPDIDSSIQLSANILRTRSCDGKGSWYLIGDRASSWAPSYLPSAFYFTHSFTPLTFLCALESKRSSWPPLHLIIAFRSNRMVRRLPPSYIPSCWLHCYINIHNSFWTYLVASLYPSGTFPTQRRASITKIGFAYEDGERCPDSRK